MLSPPVAETFRTKLDSAQYTMPLRTVMSMKPTPVVTSAVESPPLFTDAPRRHIIAVSSHERAS